MSPQSLYLTPDRLHQLASSLSDLDWQLLGFVHDSRFATGGQLIRTFWQTADRQANAARAGRRALKRLSDWRVLDPLPRKIGGRRSGSEGIVYRTGRAGVRLLATRGITGPRTEMPGALHLDHTLATTELVVRLREANHQRELELIAAQQEPDCWRVYVGAGMVRRRLNPDLFLRVGAGEAEDRWMVEVDLASESGRTIARKTARYLEHYRSGDEQRETGTYPRVLWTAPDEQRASQLREVLEAVPAEGRALFSVCLFDAAVTLIAREARL
ncbi:MAG: replication-relaxation family protein [Solirubrobacteraceae bacterium]